ncbi:MAG: T9SS type A sorting domain-containing protein [Bacteroidales bacterium]|nr:T9SS type A sorting domain-containing protein [Bacteroidales bacterium]MDD3702062.1 T9SS type A sorting domain-containing protein [Bacteroidales bacterium]MDY0369691.1 T9SS type A sorting domain-containing protein [Bacteroidales bacterium]
MRRFLSIFMMLWWASLYAQDTLTIMQYNLLYYGQVTGFCNNSNNSLEMKDPYLQTILRELRPDVFTVNELSKNEAIHDHLLEKLGEALPSKSFQRAASSNISNSTIVNMLYYNSRKLSLKAQYTAQTYIRDIDVYELYYNSDDLSYGDTAFLVCAVCHLKAGQGTSEANTRKIMVENTLRFLETRYEHSNVLFMGDFNFYTGFEQGFQLMLNYENPNMRFFDPIGQIGDWNNNSFYATIHTQSTNVAGGNCKAGGGMDDRFDLIMISDEIRFGTKDMRYIQETYKAIGQDGQRFKATINGMPQNAVVSQEMADALFYMSDHLPVSMQIYVDKTLDLPVYYSPSLLASIIPNPVQHKAVVEYDGYVSGKVQVSVFDLSGNKLFTQLVYLDTGTQRFELDLYHLRPGFYFLQLTDDTKRTQTLKLIKL